MSTVTSPCVPQTLGSHKHLSMSPLEEPRPFSYVSWPHMTYFQFSSKELLTTVFFQVPALLPWRCWRNVPCSLSLSHTDGPGPYFMMGPGLAPVVLFQALGVSAEIKTANTPLQHLVRGVPECRDRDGGTPGSRGPYAHHHNRQLAGVISQQFPSYKQRP